jgi:hypothetical protein
VLQLLLEEEEKQLEQETHKVQKIFSDLACKHIALG